MVSKGRRPFQVMRPRSRERYGGERLRRATAATDSRDGKGGDDRSAIGRLARCPFARPARRAYRAGRRTVMIGKWGQHDRTEGSAAIWRLVVPLALLTVAAGPPDEGRIRYVTDGDTFRLESGERIRIAGIDAPETHAGQAKCRGEIALGRSATARVRTLLDGRNVTIMRVGRSYSLVLISAHACTSRACAASAATSARRRSPPVRFPHRDRPASPARPCDYSCARPA